MADFASLHFSGKALKWHSDLPPDVRQDWFKLERALLERWPPPADEGDNEDSGAAIIPTPAATSLLPTQAAKSSRIGVLQSVPISGDEQSMYISKPDSSGQCELSTEVGEAIRLGWDRSVDSGARVLEWVDSGSKCLVIHWSSQNPNFQRGSTMFKIISNIRVLKKFKVLWFNEYAKKRNDSDPTATAPATLIPRPPGEKGKNGWNLQEAMRLKDDDGLYAEILRTARHCISRSGLDWDSTYSEQDPGCLAACFRELKKQQPYLERFQGDWPVKGVVISALQNRRKYRNAKTKAKLATDQETQNDMARADEALAAE